MTSPVYPCWECQLAGLARTCPHAYPLADSTVQWSSLQQSMPHDQSYHYQQSPYDTAAYGHTSYAPGTSSHIVASRNQHECHHHPQRSNGAQPVSANVLSTAPTTIISQDHQYSYASGSNDYPGGLPSPSATSNTVDVHEGGYQGMSVGQQAQHQAPAAYDERSTTGNSGRYEDVYL